MTLFFQRDEPRELKSRIPYVVGFALLAFSILIFRFWYLQIFKGEELRELSENNRIRLVRVNAYRGRIFDRNGKVLVENRPVFVLTVVPEDVRDWEGLMNRLSSLIVIDDKKVQEILKRAKGRPYFEPVVLRRNLTWEEVAKIETYKLDLPGVSLDVEMRRFYPWGELASHILGYLGEVDKTELRNVRFADYRQGELVGKDGIEEREEEYLRGVRGGRQVEVDVLGRVEKIIYELEPLPGKDIYLTIDFELQRVAEEAMGGRVGAVIALDPQTGKILAMASAPSFNPNLFAKGMSFEVWHNLISDPNRPLENKAIQGQYPPASTFKVVVAAAALEEKILEADTKIFSGGSFVLGRRIFRDWKKAGHGYINVHKAIVESADTFFYQVGLDLGVDRIARYAKDFGFGEKTGVALNNEKAGLVPTTSWKRRVMKEPWFDGETLIVAIGQGYFSATPLQVLNAFATIANGRKVLLPQIVERIEDHEGQVYKSYVTKEIGRLTLSKKNLRILQKALLGVVQEKDGTGRMVRIDGIKVAGKTGTAQVVKIREDEYEGDIPYELRDHSWFVGFAPFANPEIAVVVLAEHGGYGAATAAPIARKVIKAFFSIDNKQK